MLRQQQQFPRQLLSHAHSGRPAFATHCPACSSCCRSSHQSWPANQMRSLHQTSSLDPAQTSSVSVLLLPTTKERGREGHRERERDRERESMHSDWTYFPDLMGMPTQLNAVSMALDTLHRQLQHYTLLAAVDAQKRWQVYTHGFLAAHLDDGAQLGICKVWNGVPRALQTCSLIYIEQACQMDAGQRST